MGRGSSVASGVLSSAALPVRGSARRLWLSVLVFALLGSVLAVSGAGAQSARGVVGSLAVRGGGAGELVVSWVAPVDPAVQPTDYRLDWAAEGEQFTSWRVDEGHLYPSGELTEATVTGLEPGGSYSVRLRARYHSGQFGRSPWSGPWTQTADAVQAGAAAESQAESDAEGESGIDAEGRPDSESGSEPESETESDAEGESESESDADAGAEVGSEGGVALGGVLGMGEGSYRGSPFVGYTYWTGVGSFEWSQGALGSVYVKSLVWLRGEVNLRGRGGLVDPVLLTAQGPVGSPFVLTVGDAVFASADAVVPAGEANTQTHYWIWDRACPRWAVGDEAALTLTALGPGDASSGSEVGLSLGSLELAGAVLRDGFDPAAADHVADADIGTATVTIEATAADSRACGVDISPADADPDTDGHQLKLAADGAVATVTATAPGGNAATHTLTVTRGSRAPAALTGLDVDGAPEVEFDPAERRYETTTDAASVRIDAAGADGALIDITAVRSDQPASVDEAAEGTVQLASGGDTTVVMRVTTPDAQSESVYTMLLQRPGAPAEALAPVGTRGRSVPSTVSALVHTQTAVPATANTRSHAQTAFPMSFGSGRSFSSDGAAPDAVHASKNGDAGTDGPTTRSDPDPPRLTGLAVNPGPLAPGFDAAVFAYTAAVDNTVTHITVTPQIPTGATAAITPADADADTPGHQVALNAIADGNTSSQTAIAVVVTAGTEQQTYTVTVTRAAPLGTVTMELPDGCTLRDLSTHDGTAGRVISFRNARLIFDSPLVPYPGGSYYEAPLYSWNNGCPSLFAANEGRPNFRSLEGRNAEFYRLALHEEGDVYLDLIDQTRSHLLIRSASGEMLAYGGDLDDPSAYAHRLTQTLPRGTYVVEAATHWYHHNRGHHLLYSGPTIARIGDYELDALGISDVNMAGFASDVFDYTRNVAGDVSVVTVAATGSLGAQVEILPADADPSTAAHEVNIVAGGVTEITVTASSPLVEATARTYRVALTQLAGTTAPLSDDASLASLSFEGLDIGTFSSEVTEYTFPLDYYKRIAGVDTTMTFATTHVGATWVFNGADADPDTDGHQFAVTGAVRNERFVVTVTSQDGAIIRTYTVTPQRPLTPDSARNVPKTGSWRHGLWSDGQSLVTFGCGQSRDGCSIGMSVYDIATRSLTRSVESSERILHTHRAEDIWSDGETVWVLYDSVPGRESLYAYSLATGQRTPQKDIGLPGTGTLTSFWTDGQSLYLYTPYWETLYGYDFAVGVNPATGKRRLLDLENEQTEWFRSGVAIWSDGTTLWITQRGPGSNAVHHPNPGWVFAYDLATRQRVPGLDFHVPTLNGQPIALGLWSDGRTMWVNAGSSLYANTLPENARLSSLSVSDAEMDFFYNGKFAYDAVVPAGTVSVTVAATAAFSGGLSSVVISPADADSVADGHQVALTAGMDNVVSLVVTAPNGTDTETYTVTITHTD